VRVLSRWYPGKILKEGLRGQEALASQQAPRPGEVKRPPEWVISSLQKDVDEERAASEHYESLAGELEKCGLKYAGIALREIAAQERAHRTKLQDILLYIHSIFIRER